MVVHGADKNRIQRQAKKRAINRRKSKHPPGPQRRENVLDPLAVSVDKIFDLVQVGKFTSEAELGRRSSVVTRWPLVVGNPPHSPPPLSSTPFSPPPPTIAQPLHNYP